MTNSNREIEMSITFEKMERLMAESALTQREAFRAYTVARLIAERAALLIEFHATEATEVESGVWQSNLESGKIYQKIVDIDNRLGAMDMTDDQLLAGWANGGAGAQAAIADERFNRGI